MSAKSAQQIVSNATESLHSTSSLNTKLILTDADNPLIPTDLSDSITLNNSENDDEFINTQNLTLFTDQELQSFDTLLNTDKDSRDPVVSPSPDNDITDSVDHHDARNGDTHDKSIEYIDGALDVDQSNGITHDDCLDQNGTADSSNHVGKKSSKPTSLRLVITDTDDGTDPPIVNKTKKFYETDDAFISAIFSQTITSTTATPTDDDLSYSFDPPFTESVAINGANEVEKTGVGGDQWMTVDDTVNADHSMNESHTENLDNYNEGLVSLTHTVCLDGDDFDRYDEEDDVDSSKAHHYENVEQTNADKRSNDDDEDDGIYENVLMLRGAYKQRPSIVVDCYTDDAGSAEHFNVEPAVTDDAYNVVVASYFDQTIEDEDDIDIYNDYGKNECENGSVKLGDAGDGETSSSEEDDNSDSVDEDDDIKESCSNVEVHKAIERFESETSTMVTTKKTIKQSSVTSSSTTATTASATVTAGVEEVEAITAKKSEKATKKKSEATGEKKKKSKKSKKSDPEKENISVSALSPTYRYDTLQSWNSNNACCDKNDCNHNATSVTNQTKKSPRNRWTTNNTSSSDIPPATNNIGQFLSNQKTNSIVLNNPFIVNAVLNGDRICGRRCQMSLRNSDKLTDQCCDMSNKQVVKQEDDSTCDGNRSEKGDEKIVRRSSVDKFVEETLSKKIIPSNVVLHEDDLSSVDVKNLKKIYLMEQPPHQHVHRERCKENRVIVKDVSVKHLRAKSVGDLRKLEQLPIQTGVSVRALRDSYCSLVALGDGCLQRHTKAKQVKFGVIQYDMKSSFSKFDALQKKNILHVRSSDAGKAQEKFNGVAAEAEKNCRACGKAVYKMEEMKAERNIWHKNCFKCSECNKQLNVDTYESHESILYCKPHFKALFTPKAVEDSEPAPPRRPELIIRENQPIELPPDVVRSSDKTDLGLEELHQLNVKSRYEIFENAGQMEQETVQLDRSPSGVKRSATILSKLARFQSKGMDVGLTDESLNGVTLEDSSEDELNGDDENGEDIELIRAKRAQRERPLSFANMSDIKSKFETGHSMSKEERREERKQEIQNIRSRLFMGKQAKIKEMYQQAVLDSEQGVRSVDKKHDVDIGDKAKSIKDRFEKGEIFNEENEGNHHKHQDEDMAVFEQGIGKKSRSMFMEMDANAAKSPSVVSAPQTPDIKKNSSPIWPPPIKTKPFEDVVKCDDKVDDIKIETADISNKFKFFETYKPSAAEKKQFRITPPREGVVKQPSPERQDVYIDPDVVRSGELIEDSTIAENSQTTTKMLSMFRQMEEKKHENQNSNGLKPLKRFTPPPDDNRRIRTRNSESENDCTDSEDDEDDDDGEEESESDPQPPSNQDYVRSSDKNVDEFLQQAQSAARAKQLRAKFERWESKEIAREQNNSSVALYDGNEQSQVETAKEIRAKFENMRDTSHAEPRERIKVNRFV